MLHSRYPTSWRPRKILMKHLKSIPKTFSSLVNLGYKYLVVGGCSFTNNNSKEYCVSWPLYLRDLGNFQAVFNCAYPGSGNQHIHNSVMWELESVQELTPLNTLVVVMWSGWERDDFVVDARAVSPEYSNCEPYSYTKDVLSGLTGGIGGNSNLVFNIDVIKKIKNDRSRALENFIHVNGLKHYLENRGFRYLFTEFCDENLIMLDELDEPIKSSYINLTRKLTPTLGTYNQDYLELSFDGVHPAPDVHLKWTREILLPCLTAHLNII